MLGVSNNLGVADVLALAAAATVLWGFLGVVALELAREDRRVSRSARRDNAERASLIDLWSPDSAADAPPWLTRSRTVHRDSGSHTCLSCSDECAQTQVRDRAVCGAGATAFRGHA